MIGASGRENMDRFCDYHGEKERYTNDCFQLRNQLELAIKLGKLNQSVITYHPSLNKLESSGKLAKYAIELGAYDITYEPQSAIKGKELADFLTEIPVGNLTEVNGREGSKCNCGRIWRQLDDTHHQVSKRSVMAERYERSSKHAHENQQLCDGRRGHVLEIISGPFAMMCLPISSKRCDPRDTYESLRNAPRAVIGCGQSNEARLHGRSSSRERISWVLFQKHPERLAFPSVIVMDNRTQFFSDPLKFWCKKLNIKKMNTVVAHIQANGLVERANKSLIKGLKSGLGGNRYRWMDEFPNVLRAHRTSLKQINGETPFNLTYKSEVVIPVEIDMREVAAIREAKYKSKMEQYYNQRAWPLPFKAEEFVYQKMNPFGEKIKEIHVNLGMPLLSDESISC
ncbi:reverse transcriptase domain-containing protein [Tanacetum coccineum]